MLILIQATPHRAAVQRACRVARGALVVPIIFIYVKGVSWPDMHRHASLSPQVVMISSDNTCFADNSLKANADPLNGFYKTIKPTLP